MLVTPSVGKQTRFKMLTKWPLGHSVGCRESSLPLSSPILGKVNGYTLGCTWQAAKASFDKQLFRVGPKVFCPQHPLLHCPGKGAKAVWGAWTSLQDTAGWVPWTEVAWDGAPLLGSVQSLLKPQQTHGKTRDALRKWFDTSPTQCAKSTAGLIQRIQFCSSRNHGWVTPCPAARLT